MTQEEKAKAYDEALERAKRYLSIGISPDEEPIDIVKKMSEYIFPELTESEDERIRKAIKACIDDLNNDWILLHGTSKDAVLDYLEKQKEQPKEELVYRLNGLMQDYIKESKDEKEREHRFKCYKLFWDALEDAEFFEQKEQKPAEWSDEDIEKNLIAYLRYERKSTPQEIEEKFIPYIKRIKIMEQESVSPMSYGSLDEAMQEAGRRFDLPCTDEDKYSLADVFYAGVRAERESKQEWSGEQLG